MRGCRIFRKRRCRHKTAGRVKGRPNYPDNGNQNQKRDANQNSINQECLYNFPNYVKRRRVITLISIRFHQPIISSSLNDFVLKKLNVEILAITKNTSIDITDAILYCPLSFVSL